MTTNLVFTCTVPDDFDVESVIREVMAAAIGAGAAMRVAGSDQPGPRKGRPPAGYTSVAGHLVPVHNSDRVTCGYIAEQMRSTGMSYREIAAALDEQGLRPPRGGKWQPMSVRRLITEFEDAAYSPVDIDIDTSNWPDPNDNSYTPNEDHQ